MFNTRKQKNYWHFQRENIQRKLSEKDSGKTSGKPMSWFLKLRVRQFLECSLADNFLQAQPWERGLSLLVKNWLLWNLRCNSIRGILGGGVVVKMWAAESCLLSTATSDWGEERGRRQGSHHQAPPTAALWTRDLNKSTKDRQNTL